VLIGSLVLFALSNVVAALASSLTVLLAARALAALAAAAYVPAAGAAAVAAVPADRRGRALAVVLGGSAVATVLGAPLGVLLASLLSWRAAPALVAVLAMGTVLGLLRNSIGSDPPTRSTLAERLHPLRSRVVVGTLAVTFLAMTASNSTYTYLAVLLSGPVELYIAAFGLAGMAGTWWGGAAIDRYGSRRVVTAAVIVLAAGLATVHAATAPVGLIGWGLAAWAVVAAQQRRVIELGPAPLLLALNSSAVNLGFATGALLGGLVVDAAGVGSLWLLPVVSCGAGLVLHGILGREARS
jgi:predicted MFS family arabinose efflux permease